MIEPLAKKCGKCKKIKSSNEFHNNKSRKDGLSNTCKVCFNSRVNPVIYMGNKKCLECNNVKDSVEFHKDKTGKHGLRSKCKECTNKSNKQYRLGNIRILDDKRKKYRKINLVKYRIQQKKYREINKDKIKKYMKEYREKIKDRITINNKKYIKNLPDSYIRILLCNNSQLRKEDIPNEVIKAYRQLVLLKRTLRGNQ